MAETLPDSDTESPERKRSLPGLLVVFGEGRARYHPIVLKRGEPLLLGRDGFGGLTLADQKMSSRHAELTWDGDFKITDLGSRNGTFLDGVPFREETRRAEDGVLRLGQTVLLLLEDVTPFTRGEVSTRDGMVIGPTLRRVLDQVARARRDGGHLLVRGESGAGKELVAKTFHAAAKSGPFVSFNCATIQADIAEATLFGTKDGAFTGARDSNGLFLEASGGVLFLDEVAELDAAVQGKLLRAVETGEIHRVGESRPRRVSLTLVTASHRRLKTRVKEGRFREDLMFRLAQFEVQLPPLRERLEEVPWLLQLALEGRAQSLDSSFVEAVLLRYWPGNVRELISATRSAATRAEEKGEALRAAHLDPEAGLEPEPETPAYTSPTPLIARARPEDMTKELVADMLEACDGNATEAARRLGLHRTQLSRLRKTFGL